MRDMLFLHNDEPVIKHVTPRAGPFEGLHAINKRAHGP